MSRKTMKYTQPCTVAHGVTVNPDGTSKPVSYPIDGRYIRDPVHVEKIIRRDIDRRFTIDNVTLCGYVYEMLISEFVMQAKVVDIIEKELEK